MMDQPIRLGLVGAGRWGRVYIKTLSSVEGIELSWLASKNPESLKLVGPKCRVTPNWRDLIDAPDLDGIIIAAPPEFHAEIALSAIKAKLGVLVEKPLTLSLSQAEALYDAAEQENALVIVDHIHLFNPAYRKLKELVSSYKPINFIRSIAGNRGPFRKDTPVLWDWGTHDVAMCIDLIGSTPVEVKAKRLDYKETSEGFGETLSLQLFFKDGIQADIVIGNTMNEKKRILEVNFREKVLVFDDLSKEKLKVHAFSEGVLEPGKAIDVGQEPPLTVAVKEFANVLRRRRTNLESLKLGVEVVRTLSRLDTALTNA